MLNHPLIHQMEALRLYGMAKALREQWGSTATQTLSFEERLGLLVDHEVTVREDKRLQGRLKRARLRQSAAFEDIDFQNARGLDRRLLLSLAQCDWVRQHQNLLITGPTGCGKSYIACALAHKACQSGYTVAYHRLPRLLEDLHVARADGRYPKLLSALLKVDILVLDDWALAPLTMAQQRDVLEVLDDRHDRRSTIVTSQLPASHWHEAMADPTLADALLDRLIHNAYALTLSGESMRKLRSTIRQADHFVP